MRKTSWLIILLLSLTASCQDDNKKFVLFEVPGYHLAYQLNKPDQSWTMPASLAEISGLGYVNSGLLACVEDETGTIYLHNLNDDRIDHLVDFGEKGDYEGIEIIGDDAWILKSNGTLYQVKDYLQDESIETKEYTTALSGKNDAEGLAYDPAQNILLVACKGNPFIGDRDGTGYRAVYAFSLDSLSLDPEPHILISCDTLHHHINYHSGNKLGDRITAYLDPAKGDKVFQPSGIAVHPLTGDIYILGSVGKLLLVLSGKGKMLAMAGLDPSIFPKPEGICFSPDGTLYIASEGKRMGAGRILEFVPR